MGCAPAKTLHFPPLQNLCFLRFNPPSSSLYPLAGGLTPRAALEKFASMQMIDVHLPVGEVGELVMPRYTQPNKNLALLLARMNPQLPSQPPPTIRKSVGETF